MCGIAGYARVTASHEVDKELLLAMQQTLLHRGPDGSGMWISHSLGIGLAHRRLSIVDTSSAGLQPMANNDQSVIVCLNGEIYNHATIRKELESYGYVYRSHTDTETVVYAYEQWGIDCIHRFDGMFALVIVDVANNRLFLIRDRIGIKPLYFTMADGMLSFASEIKALWPLPWVSKQINISAVSHYLTFLVPPAPLTLYQGIYKLPAGHYLKLDATRTISFVHWYSVLALVPQQDLCIDSEVRCIERIRTLLQESVEKRMMSDVPVGAFLSGGLDSSLIVALMSRHTKNLKTFTIAFDSSERDERLWARKVANHFATEHHEIMIDEQHAFNVFQKMLQIQDEPIGDCVSIPLYCIAQEAKKSGITVMLTGEGADELFCGYDMYAKYIAWDAIWRKSQRYIPACIRAAAAQIMGSAIPTRMPLLKTWAHGQELFWSGATIFYDEQLLQNACAFNDPLVAALSPGIRQTGSSHDAIKYWHQAITQRTAHARPFTHIVYRELQHRLPELLLTRLDKMTMAASVEGRVPFLDPQLVAYALQIPQALHLKDGTTKYLLKKACEGIVPDEIIYRKKIGFAAPVTHWFKKGTYFRPYFKDLMHEKGHLWADILKLPAIDRLQKAHERGQADYGYHLWALQNILATDGSNT